MAKRMERVESIDDCLPIPYSEFYRDMGRDNKHLTELPYNPFRLPSLFLFYVAKHFQNKKGNTFCFKIENSMDWLRFEDDVRDIFDFLPEFQYFVKMNFNYKLNKKTIES